jgi:hypothetical protein
MENYIFAQALIAQGVCQQIPFILGRNFGLTELPCRIALSFSLLQRDRTNQNLEASGELLRRGVVH